MSDNDESSELKKFLSKVLEKVSEADSRPTKSDADRIWLEEAMKLEKLELESKLAELREEIRLGRTTIQAVLSAHTIQQLLGTIYGKQLKRNIHLLAQKKLAVIGYSLEYSPVTEYINPIVGDEHDTIDVVWKRPKTGEIMVAFQINAINRNSDFVPEAYRKKLDRLHAERKFLVNVSANSGQSNVHEL